MLLFSPHPHQNIMSTLLNRCSSTKKMKDVFTDIFSLFHYQQRCSSVLVTSKTLCKPFENNWKDTILFCDERLINGTFSIWAIEKTSNVTQTNIWPRPIVSTSSKPLMVMPICQQPTTTSAKWLSLSIERLRQSSTTRNSMLIYWKGYMSMWRKHWSIRTFISYRICRRSNISICSLYSLRLFLNRTTIWHWTPSCGGTTQCNVQNRSVSRPITVARRSTTYRPNDLCHRLWLYSKVKRIDRNGTSPPCRRLSLLSSASLTRMPWLHMIDMLLVLEGFLQDTLTVPAVENISIKRIIELASLFLNHNRFYYDRKIYQFKKGSPNCLPLTSTLRAIYIFQWQKLLLTAAPSIRNQFFGRWDSRLCL